ncbi:MAG: trypsin-like peptidase domain-containing protein [Myxococcales bacterium]|nr:trypsin-like peptidase domain-containing protein [Myxococcales bacterium]MCB9712574.1 trypsin-like peptidase domain-containing protein [Myxococcales bacterium]
MERGTHDRPSPLWLAAGTGLVGVSLGAVAVLLGTRSAQSTRSPPPVPVVEPVEPATAAPPTAELGPRPPTLALADAVDQTRDAVVNLATERSPLGAGVIVHPRGIVVTNYHVIAEALEVPREQWALVADQTPTVTARFEDGRELPAVVLVADSVEDLAILRLRPEGEERFTSARLGRSSALRVGQEVFAIGNPFGLNHSVSRGIVSALDRTEVLRNRKLPLVQLDASINLGNSGGPLFALDGSLVGIVTLRRKDAEGIAFAVPVDHVRAFLEAVGDPTTPRRTGAIGVEIVGEERREGESDGLGYAAWVRVVGVDPEGTAAAAGILEGDRVVEIRGKRLDGLPQPRGADAMAGHLVSAVRSLFPGERLPLTIVRDGTLVHAEVEIASAASERQMLIDSEELLGLQLRAGAGVPVIERVMPGSSIAKLGADLRGIEIVRLVDEEIESLEDLGIELERLRSMLRQSHGPFWVTVGLRSPKTRATVPVPVLVE